LNPIEETFNRKVIRSGTMAKINSLSPGTKYEAQLQVKTSSGWTDPSIIQFDTPEILKPIINLKMENIRENTAKVTWERNGTQIERYVLIQVGPFSESKTVILADHDSNKENDHRNLLYLLITFKMQI